jgi:hypothetical protein
LTTRGESAFPAWEMGRKRRTARIFQKRKALFVRFHDLFTSTSSVPEKGKNLITLP